MSRLETFNQYVEDELCSAPESLKEICDNKCFKCPSYAIEHLKEADVFMAKALNIKDKD